MTRTGASSITSGEEKDGDGLAVRVPAWQMVVNVHHDLCSNWSTSDYFRARERWFRRLRVSRPSSCLLVLPGLRH